MRSELFVALSSGLAHAAGAKSVDREIILRIDERCDARPACAARVDAERLDGVFVTVLGMNRFATAEVERLAASTNFLARQTDEMHLDATLFLIVERAMTKTPKVEVPTELAVDAREQIEVE